MEFTTTSLWRRTLEAQSGSDESSAQREHLRAAFLSCRQRAATLAGEIPRELPDHTVHDITHIDALWSMADLIAGPDYAITPTEAFVLGGAFLCHDLAMSLGAYPDGLATLRGDSRWSDTVAGRLRERLGRSPSKSELKEPPPDILEAATQELLRLRHAEQAEQLPTTRWTAHRSADSYYLIDDPDLRSAFGSMIGRVAHSHWWPVTELARKCRHVRGAPGGFPNSWTIDELKVAALLRTADAGHLDERRAPGFLMAIRKPPPDSAAHWSFQGKLAARGESRSY